MFGNLLIHPRTFSRLEAFVKMPSHALILTGPAGSGKHTVAEAVAAAIIGVNIEKLTHYPYYSLTNPDEQSITIDEIRALQRLLLLKTPLRSGHVVNRVLCIINAGRMRHEAQNSFLKSLEEPPADTCIILTSEAEGDLLPTIYSRAQKVNVLPISEAMARDYYSQKGIPGPEISKNYALSQGQAGLLHSLLHAEANHSLKEWVDRAKELLVKPASERLLDTDELSRDKQGAALLLNALGRIAHAALISASKSGNENGVKRWKNSGQAILDAKNSMSRNANLKLLLDRLLLSL